MRKIILVKHASPWVQPGVPSDRWPLSPAGKEAAAALAPKLKSFAPAGIISSTEPKAVQTAEIIGRELGLTPASREGLHEHERRTVPHLRTAEFLSRMALVFKRKDEVLLGEESASTALNRFRAALDEVCRAYPEGNLIVVAHGTVIALFLESVSDQDGYRIWREMGLPSYAVVEDSGWRIDQIVAKVV